MSAAREARAIVGLSFGDEGKGATVDHLAREASAAGEGPPCVVRFNGGPQAAHHVVTPDGRTHCFAQIGAGALAGARTLLGPAMVVDLLALDREASALVRLGVEAPLSRVRMHVDCTLLTPHHRLLNRMQELARGTERHGSCGRGVAQAALDARNPTMPSVRAGALRDRTALTRALRLVQLVKLDQAEQLREAHPHVDWASLDEPIEHLAHRRFVDDLADRMIAVAELLEGLDEDAALARAAREGALFEGAQGVLLDEWAGFFPHVTPSTTTFAGARTIATNAGVTARRLGVLRAYATRHGAGPFVAHDERLSLSLEEPHNTPNPWQGPMRCGWFDAVAARYAVEVCGGVDELAITCLDRLAGRDHVELCVAYRPARDLREDLDDLFILERRGGETLVTGIRPPVERSYERQRRVTRALAHMRPVTIVRPGWPTHAQLAPPPAAALGLARDIAALAGADGARLLVAFGPTSRDRHWVD